MRVKLQTEKLIQVDHWTRKTRKLKTKDSEKHSVGYATMTTESDVDSEVRFRENSLQLETSFCTKITIHLCV